MSTLHESIVRAFDAFALEADLEARHARQPSARLAAEKRRDLYEKAAVAIRSETLTPWRILRAIVDEAADLDCRCNAIRLAIEAQCCADVLAMAAEEKASAALRQMRQHVKHASEAAEKPADPSFSDLFSHIRTGDRVTIRTPHGQERTGRAVMRGPSGWVLNLGGRHGTPGIATPDNVVRVVAKRGA